MANRPGARVPARVARLMAAMVIAGAVAMPVAAIAAAGTAGIDPPVFDRGDTITIEFDATGGPLAGVSPVQIHYGFNNWSTVSPTDPAMTSAGANLWTYTLAMPADKTQVDFVFRNAAGTIYDNNDSADWHLTVDLSSYALGSTVVPGSLGGGTVFKVWAPNATTALVRGEFNSFGTSDAMIKDVSTGHWSKWIDDAVAGQRYKYYLDGTTWRKDPRARRVNNSNGDSFIYNPDAFDWTGDWTPTIAPEDMIIYEMHLGAFEDGVDDVAPGTFAEVIPKLGADVWWLGVNVVELMPVNEFPGSQSGGYNLSDPYAIEASYGSADGLKAFVRQCHELGMAVVIDVVHNHYGPSDLDLYDFEGGGGAGIYFYDSPPELANSGFGPRPDYTESEVRAYIKDNIRMWLDEYKVDGFRWDFTKGIRGVLDGGFNVVSDIPEGISLLRECNDLIDGYPWKISIAEDLANDADLVTPTSSPGGLGFDAQWNIDFHYAVVDALDDADADRMVSQIASQIASADRTQVNFLESHDEVWALNGKDRLPTRIDPATPTSYRARKLSSLGAAVLLFSEGIPMIFHGQEWGETERWSESVGTDWTRPTTAPYNGMLFLYQSLTRLRSNVDGTSRGLSGDTTEMFLTLDPQKVLAWTRRNTGGQPGDEVVILANFSNTNYPVFDIGFPSPGTWYELFNSDSTWYGSDYGNNGVGQTVLTVANPMHGYAQRGSVAVGPYSFVVLSQAMPSIADVPDWREFDR